jgi:hypothetical protein
MQASTSCMSLAGLGVVCIVKCIVATALWLHTSTRHGPSLLLLAVGFQLLLSSPLWPFLPHAPPGPCSSPSTRAPVGLGHDGSTSLCDSQCCLVAHSQCQVSGRFACNMFIS